MPNILSYSLFEHPMFLRLPYLDMICLFYDMSSSDINVLFLSQARQPLLRHLCCCRVKQSSACSTKEVKWYLSQSHDIQRFKLSDKISEVISHDIHRFELPEINKNYDERCSWCYSFRSLKYVWFVQIFVRNIWTPQTLP